MEYITEEQLQEKVAELNSYGVISATLEWTFDLDGRVASEIYGVLSYGWEDKKHRVEFCSEHHETLFGALDILCSLASLKEAS